MDSNFIGLQESLGEFLLLESSFNGEFSFSYSSGGYACKKTSLSLKNLKVPHSFGDLNNTSYLCKQDGMNHQ